MLVRKRKTVLAILLAILLGLLVANLGAGAFSVSPIDVVRVLLGHAGLGEGAAQRGSDPLWADQADSVVWNLRLPRALLAALVGGALGVAGGALQAVFRNPLAEPSVIGVSSGAALGAVAIIVTGFSVAGVYTVPLAAFVAGMAATVVVFTTATHGNRTDVVTLVLAGVAVNVTAAAATGMFTYVADDDELRGIVFWTLGSVSGATWTEVRVIAPPILVAVGLLCLQARRLDLLSLGDREAGHLGVDVGRARAVIVSVAAAATGAAVATAGVVGFVGLVVPHIVRMTIGPHHRILLPASALGGAAMVLGADLIARTVVVPEELPLGVVTALVGGPYFLWLVRSQRTDAGAFA